jgi:hypothetical protein
MIKENCQHHFHLAVDLACLFWPQSHLLWWLGFCVWVIPTDPGFTLLIIVFMKLATWSAHCSKSLASARRVSFCSAVSSFRKIFTETHFMPKYSVRIDCTKPNESPNLSKGPLIVIPAQQNALCRSTVGSYSWRASLTIHHSQLMCVPLWTHKPFLNLCTTHCLILSSLLNHAVFSEQECRSFWQSLKQMRF